MNFAYVIATRETAWSLFGIHVRRCGPSTRVSHLRRNYSVQTIQSRRKVRMCFALFPFETEIRQYLPPQHQTSAQVRTEFSLRTEYHAHSLSKFDRLAWLLRPGLRLIVLYYNKLPATPSSINQRLTLVKIIATMTKTTRHNYCSSQYARFSN